MKTLTYNPETHVLVPREPSEEMCDAATADSCWENMNPPPSTAYRLMLAAAPQPEPNHNWCAGCSPDNCSGCGTEQVESEPVAWCLAYDDPNLKLRIHSNPTMCEAEIDAHVKGLNGALSKAPLYTTPQPYRVTTKESYVELDIHSNHSRTEQQRKLDGSLEVGQLLGNGQNQETSHSKTVGDILLADAFRGDAANLIESIVALVSLDRAGVLVPHGIGGHARSLLESAAIRLSQPDRTAELEQLRQRVAELDAALMVAKAALNDCEGALDECRDYPITYDTILEALAKINEVLK